MGKKKETRQEKIERIRREAENDPSGKRLRELYQRGMAELEERRKLDPDAR